MDARVVVRRASRLYSWAESNAIQRGVPLAYPRSSSPAATGRQSTKVQGPQNKNGAGGNYDRAVYHRREFRSRREMQSGEVIRLGKYTCLQRPAGVQIAIISMA